MVADLQRRIQLIAPFSRSQSRTAGPDYLLIVFVGALVLIGIICVYSVSFGPLLQSGKDPFSMIERHLIFVAAGLIAMVLMMQLDYHFLIKAAVPLLGGTVVLLIAVLVLGEEVQGARRWLSGNSLQPSEIAKIATVIYIGTWVTSKGSKVRQFFYGTLPFGILVGIVAGLVYLEPNLSTAALIAITALVMFFVAGADLIQFTGILVGGIAAAAAVIVRSPYQLARLQLLFTDPFKVPNDQAWQLEQSLLALASGGILGRGPGTGGSQYGFVPLAHSDGIFAVWGEELGLVGALILVGLIVALAYRGFRIASNAPDDFGRVLAAGLTFWLVFQSFINIGVVTQLVPFTGQPLPLISYGGSSTVTVLIAIGVLLSISRARPAPIVVKSAPRSMAVRRASSLDKAKNASFDYGWRNRRSRLSSVGRSHRARRRTRDRLSE